MQYVVVVEAVLGCSVRSDEVDMQDRRELELINRFDDTVFGFECPLTDLQVSGQHGMSLALQ